MNDFLINEIAKIQEDIKRGITYTYENDNWTREALQRATGRIESILNLLQNKTITVKYKEGE